MDGAADDARSVRAVGGLVNSHRQTTSGDTARVPATATTPEFRRTRGTRPNCFYVPLRSASLMLAGRQTRL